MDQAYLDLLEQTKQYAAAYVGGVSTRPAFPDGTGLAALDAFDEPLPAAGADPARVIEQLHRLGAPGTTAATGGRYFGFVTGGLLPVAHAAEWLTDTWNQNAALYLMSPVASKLETVCERWLTELFDLPPDTAMGLVTGSSNALICALAAARGELFRRQGYDLAERGLRNAPPIRVVLGEDAHVSVSAALAVLGIGRAELELVPADAYGRMRAERLPALDARTLLILQAGNVNGGSYDPIDTLCDRARAAGAWVHIDGAFGLWARASGRQRHFVAGMEKADSWSVDAHKTLNAGYDCGIVLCRHRDALSHALQAGGAYVPFSEQRDGMRYATEMSRRARGVALWAVLKQLGASGVEQLLDTLCDNAEYFAAELEQAGYQLVIPVFFNQFLIRAGSPERTRRALERIQAGGVCWCGGSLWKGEPVIRVSVCSHATTRADIDQSVAAMRDALRDA